MVAGARCADFDPKVETKLYLKRARKMSKNLITASTQRVDSGLIAVSQRTTMHRVVAEEQTNAYP